MITNLKNIFYHRSLDLRIHQMKIDKSNNKILGGLYDIRHIANIFPKA